jgi:hypothetical protein
MANMGNPASIVFKAKSKEIWDAVKPFLLYLMRLSKVKQQEDLELGLFVKLEAEDAEWLHIVVSQHKLPLNITIDVEAIQ